MKTQREIITGVEIGTSSIKVVLAEFVADNMLSILGVAEKPSLKMCKGEAIDAQIVSEQVALALHEVEEKFGYPIGNEIFLGLSGAYIETRNVNATVVIQGDGAQVSEDYIVEATRCTQEIEVPEDLMRLPQVVNRYFRLSDGRVLFNPVGQNSDSLTVETQHFLANSYRANTTYCLLTENLENGQIPSVIYAPLAISSAVFPPRMNDDALGLVIDIGAGMTSIAMPTSMGHLFCGQISVGCEHIVNDLSIAFHIEIATARNILNQFAKLHCTAIATKDDRTRMIRVNPDGKRRIPASSVELVVEVRLRELFELVRRQLEDRGAYSWLGNEVLLSGGGAEIPGIRELAGTVFNRPVRIVKACNISGRADLVDSPRFNHVLGLIRAGYRDLQISREIKNHQSPLKLFGDSVKKILNAFFDW